MIFFKCKDTSKYLLLKVSMLKIIPHPQPTWGIRVFYEIYYLLFMRFPTLSPGNCCLMSEGFAVCTPLLLGLCAFKITDYSEFIWMKEPATLWGPFAQHTVVLRVSHWSLPFLVVLFFPHDTLKSLSFSRPSLPAHSFLEQDKNPR